MLGVREQWTISWIVQLAQLPRVLPVERQLRPIHVHRRLWRNRRGHLRPVWPSSVLQQSVSIKFRLSL